MSHVISGIVRASNWVLVAAIVAAGGCGDGHPPTYRAGGVVTFPNGKPLTNGWVEFQLVAAGVHATARGQIQPDGRFELGTYQANDGAVTGEYRALVVPSLPVTDAEIRSAPPPIDPRFRSFDTSGLKFTVTRDPAKNQFTLQVEPARR